MATLLRSSFWALTLVSLSRLGSAQSAATPPAVTAAQSPSFAKDQVIRLTTKEVVLDLIVRDKKGHLVTDLRPDEVTVLEDGVAQHVNQFRFVGGHEQMAAETSAAKADAARSDAPAGPNTLRETNYVSIVLAPMAADNLSFAREAMLGFFKAETLENTLVTIYRQDTRLRTMQPYTQDVALLKSAAEKVTSLAPSPAGSDAGAVFSTQSGTLALGSTAAGPGANPMAQPSLATNDPTFQRFADTLDASTPGGAASAAQAELQNRLRFMDSRITGMTMLDGLRQLILSQARLQGRKVVLVSGRWPVVACIPAGSL